MMRASESAPKVIAPTKSPGNGFRLKWIGVAVSIVITAIAVFALTHTLKSIDTREVFEVIRHTDTTLIVLAAMLVVASYVGLTFYDLLALRTIGRTELPYRIAALASFTSYPIAHGIGAVSLISPVIRYRIYSFHGLTAFDVVNICFLTGLTYWLGNLTALGIGLLFAFIHFASGGVPGMVFAVFGAVALIVVLFTRNEKTMTGRTS